MLLDIHRDSLIIPSSGTTEQLLLGWIDWFFGSTNSKKLFSMVPTTQSSSMLMEKQCLHIIQQLYNLHTLLIMDLWPPTIHAIARSHGAFDLTIVPN